VPERNFARQDGFSFVVAWLVRMNTPTLLFPQKRGECGGDVIFSGKSRNRKLLLLEQ